ncbi:hypothetical protein [Nonomuraea aridisoli]|uniref:Tetratricopeptide repeat protein n=1 Tax=Nonomuraea aridisoli TaxID=2070368 RepID=A0A2W2EDN0_9ACTN|nr:hypothetical protein [Nonomuraea aridisoli]PZG22466.1 hypothetical protein C1J01_03450 [Nonomuraea aridisoli]
MIRKGSDDATRKGTSDVEAIEGLLAFAANRPRWGGSSAIKSASEAVARSRALFRESPAEHTALLARCLRTSAGLLLGRGRATEALPLAQEAVALTRSIGGAPLVMALGRLAEALDALNRHAEAAAALAEAESVARSD